MEAIQDKPCPFYGNVNGPETDINNGVIVVCEWYSDNHRVQCEKCGAYGPIAATWAEAWARWNDRPNG